MTGVPYIVASVTATGGEVLAVDWSSVSALTDSLTGALLVRVAVWLALGCVVAIGLSFLVRKLRLGTALVGGTLVGILAAVAFLLALPPFGETLAHAIAAGLLGLGVALMIARARPGAAKADGGDSTQVSQPASSRAPAVSGSPAKPDQKEKPAAKTPPEPAATADEKTPPAPESQAPPEAETSSPPLNKEAAPKATKKAVAKPAPKKPQPGKAQTKPSWM